jgi:hypothetical protein
VVAVDRAGFGVTNRARRIGARAVVRRISDSVGFGRFFA